jgi:hypothetical protein
MALLGSGMEMECMTSRPARSGEHRHGRNGLHDAPARTSHEQKVVTCAPLVGVSARGSQRSWESGGESAIGRSETAGSARVGTHTNFNGISILTGYSTHRGAVEVRGRVRLRCVGTRNVSRPLIAGKLSSLDSRRCDNLANLGELVLRLSYREQAVIRQPNSDAADRQRGDE